MFVLRAYVLRRCCGPAYRRLTITGSNTGNPFKGTGSAAAGRADAALSYNLPAYGATPTLTTLKAPNILQLSDTGGPP